MALPTNPRPRRELLTVAQLARRLDMPETSLRRLMRTGELAPDAVAGRSYLFEASRVAQVKTKLREIIRPHLAASRGPFANRGRIITRGAAFPLGRACGPTRGIVQ